MPKKHILNSEAACGGWENDYLGDVEKPLLSYDVLHIYESSLKGGVVELEGVFLLGVQQIKCSSILEVPPHHLKCVGYE
ncbi:MAG: hypothetical protein ACUVTM_06125 [Candidatus Bathyarchaeia archaeon]